MFENNFSNTAANNAQNLTATNQTSIHLWITYGWLGGCLATVLVIVTIIWATLIHYSYRRKWRTLDILLAAVLLQELPNAITLLVISSIKSSFVHLPRWNVQTNMTVCDVLLWSSTACRFFQFAIITSLIADRALILKWPYQYRFTVRHSQIRFYMIALALVSSLFGAFAVISHQSHLDNVIDVGDDHHHHHQQATITPPPSTSSSATIEVSSSLLSRNNTIANKTSSLLDTNQTYHNNNNVYGHHYYNVLEFSYDPTIYDVHYGYFFIAIYTLLTLICVGSFLYVESNRPRTFKKTTTNNTATVTTISSSTNNTSTIKNAKNQQQQHQQKYFQSIATLFTSTGSSSTATSSSTSSSLSTSSPSPSRFSSLANLTNGGGNSGGGGGAPLTNHQSSKKQPSPLPSYYYPNVKQHHDQQQQNKSNCHRNKISDTLNSHYQISINDDMILQDNTNNGDGLIASIGGGGDNHQTSNNIATATTSSTYTSMTTTDNSIHRLIDVSGLLCNNNKNENKHNIQIHNNASRSNSLNNTKFGIEHQHQQQHRVTTPNGEHLSSSIISPLDLIIPQTVSRVNSFSSKSNHHLYSSSQLQLNTTDSNDSSTFSQHNHRHHHHHRHHHSAFDLRWSSVVGPVSFCFAFNHGPYLVFTLLAIFIPGIWTPFHDLILAGLSLLQALFLPLIIFISNETFREAVKRSCCWCWCCCGCGCHHKHRYHHSMHKISAKNHHKSSLAFSTNDGNVILATPPPSYLHAASTKPLPASNISSLSTTINAYHSDLDLLRKCPKIGLGIPDQSSSKLSKISFLKHNCNNNNSRELAFNKSTIAHATSMLDLSRNVAPYHHHQQQNYYQQQQQHPQQSQHYHASRSRHSLALAQQFSNNDNSLTPKSSFCRRPPSVASCHYLFSNQSVQSKNSRCSQYLFGSAMPSTKSESTLSVPLNMAAVTSSCSSSSTASSSSSSAATSNHFVSSSQSSSSVIQNQLKENIKHSQNNNNIKKKDKTNIVAGKCSPISINLNHRFDSPTLPIKNVPITNNNEIIDFNQVKDDTKDHYYKHNNHNKSNSSKGTGPKLIEFISGLAGRSSFSRKRSVRKCDSDASTFYNRHQLKRSQIAQNQLSNILYNNFYNKKFTPSAFGSEIILLPDNAKNGDSNGYNKNQSPLFRRFGDDSNNAVNSTSSSFDPYDNHSSPQHHHPQPGQFPRPHVYLPNVSSCFLEANTRSNSCQQLSILNGETDHYHNHLLLKQNLPMLADEKNGIREELMEKNNISGKNNDFNNKNSNNKNSIMALEEDEPIYASLPEEVEDEMIKASGSFSARSTLPDNCQLISYGETNNENQSNNLKNVAHNHNNNVSSNVASATTRMNGQNVNYTISMASNDNNNMMNNNDSSNSSSTVGESTEDIYEEVSNSKIPNRNDDNNSNNNHFNNRKRSASEDTLIQQNDDPFDASLQRDVNGDYSEDDDDDDISCDGVEEELLDEDQISILSETSSSTFSSFTTCANQDFEFIVSQQQQLTNKMANKVDGSKNVKSNAKNESSFPDNKKKNDSLEPPSTLSLAAMYYNRLILNKDSNHAKSGHRQRSKLNRRQSFSTAHELRQRILCNQTAAINKDNNQMALIEEEMEEGNSANGSIHDYPIFTANFDDMFPYKLDRRISSSEDNLLSIISTIVNCGDQDNGQDNATEPNLSKTMNKNVEESSDSNSSTPKNSNGTFVLKKDTTKNNSNNVSNGNVSAIPRATFLSPKSSSSSSTSSPSSSSNINKTTKITIKELKSKKQANRKYPTGSNINHNSPSSNFKTKLPLGTATAAAASNSNRVYELGSIWERQSSKVISNNSLKETFIPKSTPLSSSPSRINASKSVDNNNKSTASMDSTSKDKVSSILSVSSSVIQSPMKNATHNINIPIISNPSPSSSSSSPSRVPTFISVSPLRTPKHQTSSPLMMTNNNFTSKLTPPSEYNVNNYHNQHNNKKPKQDARKNAILAKNALLMSGMAASTKSDSKRKSNQEY